MCAMNSGKCAVDITSAPTHGLDRTVTLRRGQRTFTCAWQGSMSNVKGCLPSSKYLLQLRSQSYENAQSGALRAPEQLHSN